MKTLARVTLAVEWTIAFVVSYFLLQFGADRTSRLVTSRYVDGNLSHVDGWLTILGFGAMAAIFGLVHPQSRFYTATALALSLGLDSLSSIHFGHPQSLLVPMLSLASAAIAALSGRPSKSAAKRDLDAKIGSDLMNRIA
jgi:hypothetical protein